ncbi:lipase family protein [Corynebacterium uberis]|uniref:lipase family protein n=1 Tax=Corynebacterium TaxID=1716 RepID=UPI001D0AA080|nr:lipase family protein [Corynebacterium uberis]MCZ9309782.1 lipase family protein [Corynebacterium sp. c6VSa_13]UDL73584.1 lipase family protein [Corynebacterium uberis]UDL75536.1 lipase family protein [Corynebacterium uberis]UDL77749.1 lipase family protein [Corynebacterium uberis]UDL80032.1 lipase family protein [Corynebacterium uberis]
MNKRIYRTVAALGLALTTALAPTAVAEPGVPGGQPAAPTIPADWSNLLYHPDDPFYLIDDSQAGEPGTVLRHQRVDGGAPATKFIYSSTSPEGTPRTASAALMEPLAPWLGAGPVPTVVMAPGTRGQAHSCAPSRGPAMAGTYDPVTGATALNYELPFMYAAAAAGMRVIMIDYIGLGTGGLHRYANSVDEAHAVLDAARAGLTLTGAAPDSPIGFYGYSQGGGAVAAAAEHAATYAPDLNVKGTFAGAPPADLLDTINTIDGTAIAPVLAYAINGAQSEGADEAAAEAISDTLNESGKQWLALAQQGCIIDAAARWPMMSTSQFTTTGETLGEIAARDPRVMDYLVRSRIGTRTPNAPMLVYSNPADDVVPFPQARTMARDFCQRGATVLFDATPAPVTFPAGLAINHALPLFSTFPGALSYLIDRFNGHPAPSNCGQF